MTNLNHCDRRSDHLELIININTMQNINNAIFGPNESYVSSERSPGLR